MFFIILNIFFPRIDSLFKCLLGMFNNYTIFYYSISFFIIFNNLFQYLGIKEFKTMEKIFLIFIDKFLYSFIWIIIILNAFSNYLIIVIQDYIIKLVFDIICWNNIRQSLWIISYKGFKLFLWFKLFRSFFIRYYDRLIRANFFNNLI